MALNSNLDPKFHERLVEDKKENVRAAIASNPNLDLKFHERLVNDEDWNVRTAIAFNPNIDPKLHERLVEDGDWSIRSAIASNPNLDPKYFERLLKDSEPIVRQEIKNNPSYIKWKKEWKMTKEEFAEKVLKSPKNTVFVNTDQVLNAIEVFTDLGMLPPLTRALPEDFSNTGFDQDFLDEHEFQVNRWEE
jgi:hypothetical protein